MQITGTRWGSIRWIMACIQIGLLGFQIWFLSMYSQDDWLSVSKRWLNADTILSWCLIPWWIILTTPEPTAWGQVKSAGPMHFCLQPNPRQPWVMAFTRVGCSPWPCPGTKAPKWSSTNFATIMSWLSRIWTRSGHTGSGWKRKFYVVVSTLNLCSC